MKKTFILFILLLAAFNQISFSQFIKSFGIKGGLIFSGFTSSNNEKVFEDDSAIMNFLAYDFGLYAELFGTPKFCLSTELHYNLKGESSSNSPKIITQEQSSQGNVYSLKNLSDRYHYISFQMLPRYHFVLSKEETLYLFGGPVFDYLISNSNSETENVFKAKNSRIELAGIAGFGASFKNWLLLEFRFQHNFSPAYTFKYGNEKVTRINNSIFFLVGVALKTFKNKM